AIDDNATSFNVRVWDAITKGPSATDFRHAWTTSALYELPIGRGRAFLSSMKPVADAVLGGWQVNGIYTFRTGVPSSASLAAGLVGSTVNTGGASRPEQIAAAELPKDQRTIFRYFNTAAFVAPAANSFRFGNAGRNTIRGPSFSSLDMSLFKSFRLTERVRAQFRAEFFNLPNHPNYGRPGASFGAPSFGAITSLAPNGTMRQTQLGLKALFYPLTTPDSSRGLVRGIGLWQATAANMLEMIGVGPFLTIPLILSA